VDRYEADDGGQRRNCHLGEFQRRFIEDYFPDSVRYAKEIEFIQLEQGNLPVTEYATRFKHLARFYTRIMTEA